MKRKALAGKLGRLIFCAVWAAGVAGPGNLRAETMVWGQGGAASREMTICGVITDSFQVRTDSGAIYDLGETPAGNEAGLRVGHRVRATGVVVTDGPYMILMVNRYRDEGRSLSSRL